MQQEYEQLKNQIEAVRFKVINKKTGEKADHFIGFWLMLLDKGRNKQGIFSRGRAAREINRFWQKDGMDRVLEASGALTDKLVYEQLYDSIKIFYEVCKTDRQYGSKVLGFGIMKPEEIAKKVAYEMSSYILGYFVHIEPIKFRNLIYRAIWSAYPDVFPDNSEILSLYVKKLREDEQVKIAEIIGEETSDQTNL